MDSDIILTKVNEAFMRVEGNAGIIRELSDYLTFEVPGAKFSPKYKSRVWDGKIRLLNARNMTIYAGLVNVVQNFCEENGFGIEVDRDLTMTEEFSLAEAKEFADTLQLPFVPHDHQLRAFALAVRHSRGILISPTASGKSLIAYLIARFYIDNFQSRILILVPTISLVHQLQIGRAHV